MADDHRDDRSETLIIGEDGQVTVLDGVEKKSNRRGRKKKRPPNEDFEVQGRTRSKQDDPKFDILWERPVRKNRGLKMKRYLSQWRKSGKTQGCTSNSNSKRFARSQVSTGRKAKDQETAADEGEQSSSGVPCEATNEEQPSDNTAQDPDYSPSAERRSSKESGQKSPEGNKTIIEGPFYCPHCSVEFNLKRFIRHEWKHTGYQPFQCPHCSKRFRSYSDLVEHQKKHTKAYPFLCWECGKKFRHGVTLTRHVERVHHAGEPITEKPTPTFTCAQCGKTFTSRRCLLKHDNFHHKGLQDLTCCSRTPQLCGC
uniref:C2H2-type domain-containing protein n=1 Tax=Mastacembelus armatus TaxID=205130 RepID=A0A7N8Y8A2_9TELE